MALVSVSDQVVAFIRELGGSHVFVLTGNGAMYLNDAIERRHDMEYVCVHNEAAAAPAASAYGQVTESVGVINVTAGPGATNALAGLTEVWVDSGRVLVVAGQVPLSEIPQGASNQTTPRSFGIAGVSASLLAEPITKFSASINAPSDVQPVLIQAGAHLYSGRPGPVWIEIPLDVQASEGLDLDIGQLALECKRQARTEVDVDEHIETIITLLGRAHRPLFLLGRGAGSRQNHLTLKSVLTKLQIPYAPTRVVAYMYPMNDPLCLGVVGVRGRPGSAEVLSSADLIVGVGTSFPSSIVGEKFCNLARDVTLVRIDVEPSDGRLDQMPGALHLVSDSAAFVDAFHKAAIKPFAVQTDWVQTICSRMDDRNSLGRPIGCAPGVLNIYEAVATIESFLLPGDVYTTDAGSVYYAAGQAIMGLSGAMEITSGCFAAMGQSLPLAVGAAVAVRNSKSIVACITGDGSFELNMQELLTLRTYDLPVSVIIMNNGGYASMRTWQDTFFEGRYIGSTRDTGAPVLNFAKIADAFDLPYSKISDVGELEIFCRTQLRQPEPKILEIMCDPDQRLYLPMSVDRV